MFHLAQKSSFVAGALAVSLWVASAAADAIITTTPGLSVPNYNHNGCCNVIYGPTGGSDDYGNYGYGTSTEPTYAGGAGSGTGSGMDISGGRFIGIVDAGLGPGSAGNDAGDYYATAGISVNGVGGIGAGAGWEGFAPVVSPAPGPSTWTRYDYASGSTEYETAVFTQPTSGLDVQLAHKFFWQPALVRTWAKVTNSTASNVSYDFAFGGNLGSDGGIGQMFDSADGNLTFDAGVDQWTQTDDVDNGRDSAFTHVWGQAAAMPFTVDTNNVDQHSVATAGGAISIAPGETQNWLFFTDHALQRSELDVRVDGGDYDNLTALFGNDYLSRIPLDTTFQNWQGTLFIPQPTTFHITPHDVGLPDGVQLVGGTIMTNGEMGEGLSFSDLEPTFELELTNGDTTQILTELATTIAMSVDEPLFDVTEETITFVPDAGQFIRFVADEAPFSGLFWSGESPHDSGLLAVGVDGISEITTPPPIDIGNFAVRASGDANGDGIVDAADLAIVLANWSTGDTYATGDFNGDDTVDAADLSRLFGSPADPAIVAAAAQSAAVPEPSTWVLALVGMLGLLGSGRRRHQRIV